MIRYRSSDSRSRYDFLTSSRKYRFVNASAIRLGTLLRINARLPFVSSFLFALGGWAKPRFSEGAHQ